MQQKNRKGQTAGSRPLDHAAGTCQPKSEAASMHTRLCLNRFTLIRLPTPGTTPILLQNPLVAKEAKPKPTETRHETRVRQIQILTANRTRGGRGDTTPRDPSYAAPIRVRHTVLLRQIGQTLRTKGVICPPRSATTRAPRNQSTTIGF